MAYRHVAGQLATGDFGIRTSLPGYDVLAEGFGSANISFDSRLSDIGTVIAAGLIQCGGSPIFFPSMSYTPIFKINKWDGYLYEDGNVFKAPSGGVASNHTWITAIGVITTNSLSVIAYPGPGTFNPLALYDPTGQYFLYSIFASG